MAAVLELSTKKRQKKSAVVNLPCEKIILHNVNWTTYESLLESQAENAGVRFFYDDGDLEIMTESFKHGNIAFTLAEIVVAIADLFEIDLVGAGGTTFRKAKKRKGFEGDASFYFQNAELVRGKEELDMTIDPPPELVIEVDITHPSLPKFPIFAGIGVREIWRFDGFDVKFYRLENENYSETTESVCLPNVKSETVTDLLFAAQEMKRFDWVKLIHQKIKR